MFSKPCSVRKRSSSSSGLMPGSSRRKTFRISSSSKTIELFDCSDSIGRASVSSVPSAAKPSSGRNSRTPFSPCSVSPARIARTSSRASAGSARPSSPAASSTRSSWYVSCSPVSNAISTSSIAQRGSSSRRSAESITRAWTTSRVLEPNQRCAVT